MFVHTTRLPLLLGPEHYQSEPQYRAELASIFEPAWHLVGTIHDLPHSGDYITTTVCEKPVLLRNFDGEVHGFLNICVHRHALLSSAPCGRSWKLSCQYHGWEYEKDGRTGRIPEAKGFKPWNRSNAQLRKFRVERCGELLFLSLRSEGPSLREYLGPLWDSWSEGFDGRRFSYAGAWQIECPCNWKIPTENGLESYHMASVHPYTLGPCPDESDCDHVLDQGYSTFTTSEPPSFIRSLKTVILRLIGAEVSHRYEHHLVHPHLQVSTHDVMRLAMTVLPTSPTTSVYRSWMFTVRGSRFGRLSWPIRKALRLAAITVAKRVHYEDSRIFPDLQRGLTASPFPGMLSPREERVFEFQKYVAERTPCSAARVDATSALDSDGTCEEQRTARVAE